MGCDIHPFIEQKINGKWTLLKEASKDRYETGGFDRPSIHSRNYNVFAILANVRNGRGFAGIKTGAGFRPIDEPRGLPDDLSLELKNLSLDDNEIYLGEHSFSWLTFREIFNYDYTQTTILTGVISAETFVDWDCEWGHKHGPRSWSGDVIGGDVKHVTIEEMRKLVALHERGKLPKELEHYYTRIEWTKTYFDCAWSFLYALKWNALEGVSYDDLRLVFGFDS